MVIAVLLYFVSPVMFYLGVFVGFLYAILYYRSRWSRSARVVGGP
jgi:hypothetical protein